MTRFPDAEYLIVSSRLIPDRDGGYALATLARARQMAAAGVHDGRGPLLLTLDPGTPAEHARHQKERFPVAVCLGGDPILTYAATAPLPPEIDELLFAGWVKIFVNGKLSIW